MALLLNSTTYDLEVNFHRVLTAAGGDYRMCWCAGAPFQCEFAEDFGVDVGRLHVVGGKSNASKSDMCQWTDV